MFATRTMRVEWEVAKWIAILAMAAALAMFWAIGTVAAAPQTPRLLPTNLAATPMPETVDPNFALADALQQHAAGQADDALQAWQNVPMPEKTRHWKLIAMGVAKMQLDDLEAAAGHLMEAEEVEPNNPVTHYYLALLRLCQARHAKDWYDATGPAIVRFAAYRPQVVAPNTRGMYELVAMQEFETALANAKQLDRAMMLAVPDYRVPATAPAVTVGDLMIALGCEKFEAQAHNMLGAMYLERGATDTAEEHMDAAQEAGLQVMYGYRDLGAAFEAEGRYGDAARAYLKGMDHEPGVVVPLQKALKNFGKALLE